MGWQFGRDSAGPGPGQLVAGCSRMASAGLASLLLAPHLPPGLPGLVHVASRQASVTFFGMSLLDILSSFSVTVLSLLVSLLSFLKLFRSSSIYRPICLLSNAHQVPGSVAGQQGCKGKEAVFPGPERVRDRFQTCSQVCGRCSERELPGELQSTDKGLSGGHAVGCLVFLARLRVPAVQSRSLELPSPSAASLQGRASLPVNSVPAHGHTTPQSASSS